MKDPNVTLYIDAANLILTCRDFNLTQVLANILQRENLVGPLASTRLFLSNNSIAIEEKKSRAFTLVELLVSISVLSIVAAISVSSYPKFSDQLGVSAEAYKFLSYAREAQVYGVAGYTTAGIKVVSGLEIDKEANTIKKIEWQNPDSTQNQKYVDNKVYTTDEILNLNAKYKIDKICKDETCTDNYDKGYVFFRRPNPESRLLGTVGTILYPDQNSSTGLGRLEISISSKKNSQFVKKVVILQTGQMYVSDW